LVGNRMVKKSRWKSNFGVLGIQVLRFELDELCQNRVIMVIICDV
jgi:hypothetical protein